MSEAKISISPYAYGLGNPVRFSDPTGMLEEDGSVSTSYWGRDVTGGENSGEVLNDKFISKGQLSRDVTTFSTEEGESSGSQNDDKYKTVLKAMALVIQAQGRVKAETDFRSNYFENGNTVNYRPRAKRMRKGGALVELDEEEINVVFKSKEVNLGDKNSEFFIGQITNSVFANPIKINKKFVVSDVGIWVYRDGNNSFNNVLIDQEGNRTLEGGGMGTIAYGIKTGYYLHTGRRGNSPPAAYATFPTAEDRAMFYNQYFQRGYEQGMNYLIKNYTKEK